MLNNKKINKTLTKLEDLIDKIIFNPFRPFKFWYRKNVSGVFNHRIPQCWDYIKLAWYDYDWDYNHLLHLLIFKIKRMEKELRENDRHMGSQDYSQQMRLVIECLERVLNDDYISMIDKELKKKFPEEHKKDKENCPFKNLRRDKKVWINEKGEKRVIYKSRRQERSEKYVEEWRRLHFYYEKVRMADLRLAFHIMSPCIFSTKERFDECRERFNEINREREEKTSDNFQYIDFHYGLFNWWD